MDKKDKEYLIRIGFRIKELREAKKGKKRKKMSQTELSKIIGHKDHTTIGRIERGLYNVSLLTLKKIADALGVSINRIVDN